MLQAALNGRRSLVDSPFVPLTTPALIHDIKLCAQAGATSVHFHVRDKAGRESLRAADVREQLIAIRGAVPGIPLGISTGEWIAPGERLKHIESWDVVPDFVSINFNETDCQDIAKAVLEKEIGIEAGLSNVVAAQQLLDSGLLPHCFRILIEPEEDDLGRAIQTVLAIETLILDKLTDQQSLLLHGVGHTCWPLLELAGSKGYQLRIGLEDILYLPGGNEPVDNITMVEYVLEKL
jgi:uncharacterized protein (DUF849 family)